MANAHFRMGWIYNDQENYDDAVTSLQSAIKINPNYADAHNEMGYAFRHLGRTSEALEEYQEAVRINPQLGLAFLGLGDVYYDTKQYPEAVKAYKEGIRLKPESATASQFYNLAWCYNDVERYGDRHCRAAPKGRIESPLFCGENRLLVQAESKRLPDLHRADRPICLDHARQEDDALQFLSHGFGRVFRLCLRQQSRCRHIVADEIHTLGRPLALGWLGGCGLLAMHGWKGRHDRCQNEH